MGGEPMNDTPADEDWPPRCPECGNRIVLGVEVQGVYDGTLFWECGLHHRWPRFEHGPLHDRAVSLIEEWDAAEDTLGDAPEWTL